MLEMSFTYWNTLAAQLIVISSLLAGFSITVVVSILVSETDTRLTRRIMQISVLAAGSFLISIFAMTKILMMTTEGFPFAITRSDFTLPSVLGGIALLLGITSLITMISLSGWTKSRKMGFFTTGVGILTLLAILTMLT